MNGFRCNITGSTSDVPLAAPKVARRCGTDPDNSKTFSAPGNCTYGAKQPLYWLQAERNNVFEGDHSPPVYNDRYNFLDGAQDDIFIDSYESIPDPSPVAALPIRANLGVNDNQGPAVVVTSQSSTAGSGDNTNTNTGSGTSANDTVATGGTTVSPSSHRSTCSTSNGASGGDDGNPDTRELMDRNTFMRRSAMRVVQMSKRSRHLNAGNRKRLWHMW